MREMLLLWHQCWTQKYNSGVPKVSLENFMMDCTYVHVKSDLKNICVRQKMYFLWQ